MASKEPKSTSSIQMVDSNVSARTLSLGRQIVADLEKHHEFDTLGRWMGHYLAEKISAAEEESDPEKRKLLQTECCKLIMDLWRHRATLPNGARPLAGVAQILNAIVDLRGNDSPYWGKVLGGRDTHGNPWLKFAQEIEREAIAAVRLSILHALVESVLPSEIERVEKFRDFLSRKEVRIIEELQRLLSESETKYFPVDTMAVPIDPAEREKFSMQAVEARLQKIQDSLSKLKQELDSGDVETTQ